MCCGKEKNIYNNLGETPGTTLTHLLFQTLEPLNDATQFDLALQQRMKSTQQIITRLVEAVEKERANNERITALLRGIIICSTKSIIYISI